MKMPLGIFMTYDCDVIGSLMVTMELSSPFSILYIGTTQFNGGGYETAWQHFQCGNLITTGLMTFFWST